MTVSDVLSDDEIQERLGALEGWTIEEGRLHKEFTFSDFNAAFGFMTRVALVAEKLNHHPDWCNAWNTVRFDIFDHHSDGITHRCFELASAAEERAP